MNKAYKKYLGGNFMGKNDLDFKENPGWRVSFSIIIGVAWLAFVIIWLAFFAGSENFGFNGYQNFAIILASILVVMSLLGESWASWGKKHIPKESKEIMKTFGFKWRIQSSIIIPFLSIIFLIIWFFFYAINFNLLLHFKHNGILSIL